MEKSKKIKWTKGIVKSAVNVGIVMSTVSMMAVNIFAIEGDPGNTEAFNKMLELVFWVVRIAVLITGGAPALIKIVQGQADENPRDRNAGIAGLVVTGAVFAATFAVQQLFK